MAAIECLEASKKRIVFISSSVGFNVIAEDFKMNFLSYFTIFDVITYMVINGYDIQLFWGDLLRVCFCLVTWSFGYQGGIRIFVFVSKEKVITILYNQVHNFMLKMERDMATNVIVRKYASYIDFQTKVIAILFYLCGILTVIYPLLVYLFTKEIILPFGFVIPGLSETDQPGYALNYCHHALQVVLTVGGLVAAQCVNIVYLLGACLMIEVLIVKLKGKGKEVHANDDAQNTYRNVDLSEIVELHQEILKFVKTLESLFSVMFLVDVFAISFQITITLMVCAQRLWIPGCVIMLLATSMLLIDCAYGLYIELKFDALREAVYDLPWHLMSIKDRRTILYILARTQKPPLLTFGKMAYMNMATFVQVYKSIYSYFMVLKSFES